MAEYPFPQQAPPGIPDNYQLQNWLQRLVLVQDVQLITSTELGINGWSNAGGTFLDAGYYKDPWGRVYLQGKVSGGTNNTTVFTLPDGYRPKGEVRFSIEDGGSTAYCKVSADGTVVVNSSSGTPAGHLDHISFRAV